MWIIINCQHSPSIQFRVNLHKSTVQFDYDLAFHCFSDEEPTFLLRSNDGCWWFPILLFVSICTGYFRKNVSYIHGVVFNMYLHNSGLNQPCMTSLNIFSLNITQKVNHPVISLLWETSVNLNNLKSFQNDSKFNLRTLVSLLIVITDKNF